MADDSGQEIKEKDPVEAIRKSLRRALEKLKIVSRGEDVGLEREMKEAEGRESSE
jgi:uncharacterized protein YnzC (UPF0291/DUF896 family)